MMGTGKGFTLVELLIVVVIIGILATIAIPRFVTTKEKAYVAVMKSDLRNLATAEEAYFSANTVYTTSTTNMSYAPSTGVTVTVGAATATGWSATANHSGTPKTCGIYIGSATAPTGVTNEGQVKCP
jgi:prepilin-type N-terminal cleavage/methylation domain-containing protein